MFLALGIPSLVVIFGNVAAGLVESIGLAAMIVIGGLIVVFFISGFLASAKVFIVFLTLLFMLLAIWQTRLWKWKHTLKMAKNRWGGQLGKKVEVNLCISPNTWGLPLLIERAQYSFSYKKATVIVWRGCDDYMPHGTRIELYGPPSSWLYLSIYGLTPGEKASPESLKKLSEIMKIPIQVVDIPELSQERVCVQSNDTVCAKKMISAMTSENIVYLNQHYYPFSISVHQNHIECFIKETPGIEDLNRAIGMVVSAYDGLEP